jgi:Cu+-exporting ATPase
MAGSGRAAELGILFKGGEVFEAARRIDVVLTDKTGTLTEGRMALRGVAAREGVEPDELLALAAAAERGSAHPIARAVVEGAAERGVAVLQAVGHVERPGAGVEASVGEHLVRVGRPDGLPAELASRAGELAAEGLTVFAVWRDGEALGLLGAFDRPKPRASEAIDLLKRLGCRVRVVSGDREEAVLAAAREVGIDEVVAGVLPEGKVEEVRRLQAEGRRVAFVGDGINDGPALAQADVGVALGTGTDVAIETADILILGEDLRAVPDSLILAKRTFWVIAQNLAWAFAYNLCMIPLAVVGAVSPLLAAGVMAASSVMVVGNALRLRRYRPRSVLTAMHALEPAQAPHAGEAEAGPAETDVAEPALAEPAEPEAPIAPPSDLVTTDAPEQPIGTFARQEAHRILKGLGRLFDKQWET